jgi:hypothetical protein
MDKPDRLFRLTEDIPNPLYDRRYRYGVRGIKVFEQGSLINALSDWVSTDKENNPIYFYSLYYKGISTRLKVDDIIGKSVEITSAELNIDEVADKLNVHTLRSILIELVNSGIVTTQQIIDAGIKCDAICPHEFGREASGS